MTAPTPKMTKDKTWAAVVGSILTVGVPLVAQLATSLPPQWAAVIGGVIGLLTITGVYHAPYKPMGPGSIGSVTVPVRAVFAPPEEPAPAPTPTPAPNYTYPDPWRNK